MSSSMLAYRAGSAPSIALIASDQEIVPGTCFVACLARRDLELDGLVNAGVPSKPLSLPGLVVLVCGLVEGVN